jgi:hypothetical protein
MAGQLEFQIHIECSIVGSQIMDDIVDHQVYMDFVLVLE